MTAGQALRICNFPLRYSPRLSLDCGHHYHNEAALSAYLQLIGPKYRIHGEVRDGQCGPISHHARIRIVTMLFGCISTQQWTFPTYATPSSFFDSALWQWENGRPSLPPRCTRFLPHADRLFNIAAIFFCLLPPQFTNPLLRTSIALTGSSLQPTSQPTRIHQARVAQIRRAFRATV